MIKTADWIVDLGPEGGSVAARSSSPVRQKPSRSAKLRYGALPQADAVIVKAAFRAAFLFRVAPAIYVFLPAANSPPLIRRIHQIIDLRIRQRSVEITVLQCALFRWRLGRTSLCCYVAAPPAPGWFSAKQLGDFLFFHHRKQYIFHFDLRRFPVVCTLCSAPGFAMQYCSNSEMAFFTPLVVSR